MATNYQEWLAEQVLNEGRVVTYRVLGRAQKCHSNLAKRMLYDFHRTQNVRRAGCCHATYLISGGLQPRNESKVNGNHAASGGDESMQDSFLSSSMPEATQGEEDREDISVLSMTLVSEEDLEAVKAQYSRIDAIHIYSLQPGPLKNVHILADCSRQVLAMSASENPLESWKTYGSVENPAAKRRATARPYPPAVTPTPTTAAMKPTPKAAAVTPAGSKGALDTSSRRSTSGKESVSEDSKAIKNPAQLKKESSSIFKSFAKGKAADEKRAEEKRRTSASEAEDAEMHEASDEEDESMATMPANTEESKAKAEAVRKAKSEREETLRKMMEDDEDDEPLGQDDEAQDAEMIDAPVETPSAGVTQAASSQEEEPVTVTESAGGRRRGRRKVMKKKTTKDAEGYLVTREEAVWESFSEDEPASKPAPRKSTLASSGSAKAGKDDKDKKGKPGQGNITSFFSKK